MVIIGTPLLQSAAPSAGTVYSDDDYSPTTDDISMRARLTCPLCKKSIMPLMHKNLKCLGESYPWVGVDYQDMVQHYETRCPGCKKEIQFKIHFEG